MGGSADHILKKMHLFKFAKKTVDSFRRVVRAMRPVDRLLINNYFSTPGMHNLHIGCGGNIIDGWLNSDFSPTSDKVLHLDATSTFPFENNTFDTIFSEHVIEHFTYFTGLAMLRECHRILKNNGTIRISTPDLQFLMDLYRDDKSDLQTEYIKWSTDYFIKGAPHPEDTFVINNFVRAWGHLFIYDKKTLRSSLARAGFTDIVRCELNKSKHSVLCNIENEKRMPEGLLQLESFTLEGTKRRQ